MPRSNSNALIDSTYLVQYGNCNFLNPTLYCKVSTLYSAGYFPSRPDFITRVAGANKQVAIVGMPHTISTASATNINHGIWYETTYELPPGYLWINLSLRTGNSFLGNRTFMLPFRVRPEAAYTQVKFEFPSHSKHLMDDLLLVQGRLDVVMPEEMKTKGWKKYLLEHTLDNYLYDDSYITTTQVGSAASEYAPEPEPKLVTVQTVGGNTIQVNKPSRRRAIVIRNRRT